MTLYFQVLAFIKPFWKHILLALLLTLLYVFFNNLSIWISVDFMKELFSPAMVEGERTPGEQNERSETDTSAVQEKGGDDPFGMGSKLSFYQKMNRFIRSFIIRENRYDTLKIVCLVIFLAFLLKNIIHYSRRLLLNYIELKVVVNIRNKLHERMLHLPFNFFEKRHTGDLNSVMFNDVNAVNVVLNATFGHLILSPVQIITNIVILVLISWHLSLITFTIVPLSAFAIVKIGMSIRRRSRRVFKQAARVVSTFQEAITGIRIVKAFTSEKMELKRFMESNLDFFRKMIRERKMKYATSPINEVLFVSVLIFLLWYGGSMVYRHEGLEADAFLRFLLFLFTMFQPIKDLSGINNEIQTGLAAAERIFTILNTKTEEYDKPGAKPLPAFSGEIRYDHVSFKYAPSEPYVLKNVSVSIRKGEMVAFVGHSGSGKTTLVNLLPRFYELEEGCITLDGRDIREVTLASLRKQMGIVTQDTVLFNDTVRANIAYGLDVYSEPEIIDAARAANAWEFIEKLPQGLETPIGEKGIRLSGGQKQRLSIARAILKNPPILILDEATSALDTESERLVQDAIDNLLRSRTVLVIAHRLSTITNADKIVVMSNGKIESMGTHEELLRKSTLYRTLSQSQFITSEPEREEGNK